MSRSVSSRFMVFSERLSADYLSQRLPWHVVEAQPLDGQPEGHLTAFDLGIGQHDRIERHLEAAQHSLLACEAQLGPLLDDCLYTLLVQAPPLDKTLLTIHPSVHAAFGFLRVQFVIQFVT